MPRRIGELTETGIIAEMRAELRRLWRAVGSNQSPVGEYNEYTLASSSDSAHTLTYIPSLSLIPIACLNGLPGRYGTDYTVDFTTGIVTWSATKVAGDILSVFYQTTGDLVALSGVADLGFTIVDTFDRANSTTTINPRSDGGAWSVDGTAVGGITSNQGYFPSGSDGQHGAKADLGSTSQDVQCTLVMPDPGFGNTAILFAISPPGGGQAGYLFWVLHDTTLGRIYDYRTMTVRATVPITSFSGGSSTFRVTFNASTGLATVYQNGTSVFSSTISGATGLDTYCGISTSSGSTILFDNFQAKPL